MKLDSELRTLRETEGMAVEPVFQIRGVPYYKELPPAPENSPRQTALPMSLVRPWVESYVAEFNAGETDPKKQKKIAWSEGNGKLENKGYGSFEHYAVVEYDEEGNLIKYNNDIVMWNDGALEARTGLPTPGAVVVPIEKVNGEYYVHCFWQYRFAPWDDEIKVPEDITDPIKVQEFIALNRGMFFLTTPGGFAQFAGEKPEAVAKREAMEEAGLKVETPVFDKKNFNRANVSTLVRVGYSVFERVRGAELKGDAEKIFGKMAVRIDKFRTIDGLVGEAISFARENLGLISPSPLSR